MFPINVEHRNISSIFILGFGIGFLFHYLVRVQDKKNIKRNRYRENLRTLIKSLKEKDSLSEENTDSKDDVKKVIITPLEEEAINLYIYQKWKKLTIFLNKHKGTKTLFFIKVCMLRRLHRYDEAIKLISDQLNKDPLTHVNYYHLHYALNESELFNNDGKWIHRNDVFNNLKKAYEIDPNCLPAHARGPRSV